MEVESSTKVEKPIIENSEYDTRMYGYDENKLEAAKSQKLWMKDPKYFKRVKISPSATIKMMAHAQSGVDKGIKKGGNPIEVMGLLLGRLDVDDPNAFIVSDIFPVPAEGFETTVVTDNEEVMNYMLEVRDIAELSRKENIFGWYHTHPFDYDPSSATGHCFLSNTDVTTQLQWQRMEDSQGGTPWLAIVIDPLRSIAKGKPELAAFRVYPPEYEPLDNETPDGKIVVDKAVREKLWGNCWRRYYKLEVQYFMSTLAQQTFRILVKTQKRNQSVFLILLFFVSLSSSILSLFLIL